MYVVEAERGFLQERGTRDKGSRGEPRGVGFPSVHRTSFDPQPDVMSHLERSSSDLTRQWQAGTMEHVADGLKAKDGVVFLYVSADWEGRKLKCPKFRNVEVHVAVMENLLQATVVIVLRGAQSGPLHLNLVDHIQRYLWTVSDSSITKRTVEGSGAVDYINCIWCVNAAYGLYKSVPEAHGLNKFPCDGAEWDGHW